MGSRRPATWALAFGLAIMHANAAASLAWPEHQTPPVDRDANHDRTPTVAILLDDSAGVSPATLTKTEVIAMDVFRQAGVQVRWINCSFAEAEHRDPPGCQLSLDVPTVIVKILPDKESRRWGLPVNRLGFCLGQDVYLLMPGISTVANQQGFPVWLVLGHALVHEAGHALLGPGHSQGVMRPEFRKADWTRAEKGQLLLGANDARRIREKLVKVAGAR